MRAVDLISIKTKDCKSGRHLWKWSISFIPNIILFGGSLHKINTSYLLVGLYHSSVNWIFIVLMQMIPQIELYYGTGENSKLENRSTRKKKTLQSGWDRLEFGSHTISAVHNT